MDKGQKQKNMKLLSKVKKTFDLGKEINKRMIDFCKVMSDPTRFQIVSLLRNGALPVQEIANMLKKTNSNISHQLRLLKLHEVVKVKSVEQFRLYDLTEGFKEVLSAFLKIY
jgi:DNA-binding transcriptional ArsR family regulator